MVARVTLAEVARMAGVSVATASRALNNGPRLPREDLRRKVLDVAARLDYSPNAAAQAVARGETTLLGVVVQDISDPYFSAILSGAMQAAEDADLITTIADTRRDPLREVRYLATLRGQRARAVVLVGSRSTDRSLTHALQREVDLFRADGGRIALVSQPELDADTVFVENQAAARALAEALYALGHREFAVLAGPSTLRTATDRLEGFREGLAAHGITLTPDRMVASEFTRDGGHSATTELLARGTGARCVLAVNDVMAVGAMAALRAAGLVLPRDMAVAGFDDIATLRDVVPALTTVHVPLETLGSEAVRLVTDEWTGTEPRAVRVTGTVVIRESTPRVDAG